MLHSVIFGLPKNIMRLVATSQTANGITAQVAVNGLITLGGTATADTTITIPASGAALGTGQYTASMTAKSGYATGVVAANVMQSAQATQVIANGNFAASGSNLATGFIVYHATAVSCTGNTQTFVPTAQYGLLKYASNLSAGHRYFISALVKSAKTSIKLQVEVNASTYVNAQLTVSGSYQRLCAIASVASGYSSGSAYIADPSASGWANISVQSFMAIDMGTDASNPLYNLTADQMAALFPSYFYPTETVTPPTPLASVSSGSPATFTVQTGQTVPSVQLSIPSGTACSQYTVGLQVEAGSTATGWVSPGTQGVIFYPAVGETGSITNSGNVDAYPVITITGACANPSISNKTTGESIEVNVALGSNDTLIIDCRPATRGCYLNGTLAFGIKQGLGWMHCPPGDNVMTFNRNGYDTKRHCTISLQGRYL